MCRVMAASGVPCRVSCSGVFAHGFQQPARAPARRIRTAVRCIQFGQQLRAVVGLATDHHAIKCLQRLQHLLARPEAAIDHHGNRRIRGTQRRHRLDAQRRHRAILMRRKPPSTALRACTISAVGTRRDDGPRESPPAARRRPRRNPAPPPSRCAGHARIAIHDPDPILHRDRNAARPASSRPRIRPPAAGRCIRQAPKAPACDPVARGNRSSDSPRR